ncbi:MAG: hypothetical protein NT128_00680 [Proteobacteria bacterium]|nr:hypothetical protein [Pseudomonadota bacterium]
MRYYNQIVRFIPLACFIGCVTLFWPGLLRPDSITQMQQGISGTISDLHPPMLGFIFGIFNKIYNGPGPILLLDLALYWSAVAIFANTEKHKAKWYFLIAVFPPIISYQLLIIKDIGFVNSYLFSCAWLHFYNFRQIKPSRSSLLIWLSIIFYGTACAYQAIIALPWLCLWLGKIYRPNNTRKWIYLSSITFVTIISAVTVFNKQMGTISNIGQHLKLYDISGISTHLKKPVFPDYLTKNPKFDFERIKKLYNTARVDDLTFCADTPLPPTNNQVELKELRYAWILAIAKHPIAYLKHRLGIFERQLTLSLLKTSEEIKGETPSTILKLITWIDGTWLFTIAKWLMACIIYVILQIVFVYKGLKNFNKHQKYIALFFQNMSGLNLVTSLFFVAQASEARYAYLTIITCCFSLPLFISAGKKNEIT